MKTEKIWGWTEPLFVRNNVELHRIEANAGGYCSKHKHEHKSNLFIVESGQLQVTVWDENDEPSHKVLSKGDRFAVPPGVMHQFTAISDVVALEVYWVDLDQDDIIREYVGGKIDRTK